MLLQIEERRIEPDIVVLELTGRLALECESQRVESIVEDLAKAGCTRAILDLTGVNYSDSAGIGLIAMAAGRLKEAGGRLIAVAPAGKVLEMLKMTHFEPNRDGVFHGEKMIDAFGKSRPPATA